MTDDTRFIVACFTLAGFGLALLCALIITTIAFPKVKRVEEIVSAATLNSASGRNIWGGDPFGRLIRTSHIFMFLLTRHIPGHFRRAAGNVGNVDAQIPRDLFLWAFLPMLGLFLFGGIGFLTGGIIS